MASYLHKISANTSDEECMVILIRMTTMTTMTMMTMMMTMMKMTTMMTMTTMMKMMPMVILLPVSERSDLWPGVSRPILTAAPTLPTLYYCTLDVFCTSFLWWRWWWSRGPILTATPSPNSEQSYNIYSLWRRCSIYLEMKCILMWDVFESVTLQ